MKVYNQLIRELSEFSKEHPKVLLLTLSTGMLLVPLKDNGENDDLANKAFNLPFEKEMFNE